MTDAALTARTLLWEWHAQIDDPDREQRGWKVPYLEGLVDACEQSGLLDPEEVAAWRRLTGGDEIPPAGGDRAAAERHLQALLELVQPMSRDPAPEVLAGWKRFHGALAALHEAGVLSDADERDWRARGLAREAPWLDPAEADRLGGRGLLVAIAIPPATPEEAAADAAMMREMEAVSQRGRARAVFAPDGVLRHGGLAIVAVVTRTEATDVAFHNVGPPLGDVTPGRASLDAFQAALETLPAPALADDAGTAYAPVRERPVSAHGTGGLPDPERPQVITGVWRYQPPAPEAATAFEVVAGGARWALGRRDG